MSVSSISKPLILLFDLDNTLFCVKQNEADLSDAARKILSRKNSRGYIKKPELAAGEKKGKTTKKLKAIDRANFAGIFRKINTIIKNYENSELKPNISVKILTASLYDLTCVQNIFNTMYADEDEDLFSALNIEYFNRLDLDKINKTAHTTVSENTKSGFISMKKANLVEKMFKQSWKKQLPNLKKQRVYLIDDWDAYTQGVKDLGFDALHWPTTIRKMNKDEFTTAKDKVLEEINRLIDEVAL